MKCTWTSYMDFAFISGILCSMCITRNYYACLVILTFNNHYSREYNRRGKYAKIYNESWLSCFFILTETIELHVIHTFFVPVPLCLFHSLMTTWWAVPTRAGMLLFASWKCNKCFQWITGFNIDPQCRLIYWLN